jgi:hypothetical protein
LARPARHLASAGLQAGHDFAAQERARNLHHADRQQALAVARERFHRARVEAQAAAHGQVVGEPLLARSERHGGGAEEGADALALREAHEHVGFPARGDHGVRAAAGRAPRGQHLGEHAALRERAAGAAGERLQARVGSVGLRDELRAGIAARVGLVEARLVGQDDERVGLHEIGHEGAERVVVAELDLVSHHRCRSR